MKRRILFFSLFVLVMSCSSPLDRPYKKDSLEEDVVDLKKVLTEEELGMLAAYIGLKSMTNDKMLGKTYGDLLDEAKQMREEMQMQEEEEKRLAAKAMAEEAERIKKLGAALTVSLYEKGFSKRDFQSFLKYKFAFENKTDKDIKAFKGRIVFNDLFGEEITKLDLTYDDGVPANSTINWKAESDYNQFISKDVTLKNKDLEDLKVVWIPEKIIFEDGSILE